MSFDIYQEVTNQIVAMLEQGVVPWRCPILGRQNAGLPKNLESGKDYRGINRGYPKTLLSFVRITALC